MTAPARKPRVFSESDFAPDARKPRVFSESDFSPSPPAPEPNPNAVDAGAPFDPETSMLPAPVARAYNWAIPKMEALAVGSADLIPGATSALRGLQGAAEGAGKPEGVVGGFQRGQREAQEQRARVATDDPVLYAIPQVASLAVPSPAGKAGVVGNLLSPAGRAATAGAQSLAEGDGLDGAASAATFAGLGGRLMGAENRAARVVGTLGAGALAGRTAFDSNAPKGERLVAIANMLAAGGSLAGTGAPKQRRAAADDASRADSAREQAAKEQGQAITLEKIAALRKMRAIEDAQAAVDSLPNSAKQATNRFFDTKRSSVEDRFRAKARNPGSLSPESEQILREQDAMLARSLDSTTRQKLGDMRTPEQYEADWIAEHGPERERALRYALAEMEAKDAGESAKDYDRADADIAAAPGRIDDTIFRSGAPRLPRLPDGEIDIATAVKKSRGGDIPGAAKEVSRISPTAKIRAAGRLVEDVVGGKKVGRDISHYLSMSGEDFSDPAAASAIYRALSASKAPPEWKNIASRYQDGLPAAAVRAWILRNKDAEAAVLAEAEAKQTPRARALQNVRKRGTK